MKLKATVLALSIAANALLAASVVVLIQRPTNAPLFGNWWGGGSKRSGMIAEPAKAPALNPSDVDWSQLHTDDLRSLVKRLRALGFPADVIRAIVTTEVNAQFKAKRLELLDQNPAKPYWKARWNGGFDPKLNSAMRDLGKQQASMVKICSAPPTRPIR